MTMTTDQQPVTIFSNMPALKGYGVCAPINNNNTPFCLNGPSQVATIPFKPKTTRLQKNQPSLGIPSHDLPSISLKALSYSWALPWFGTTVLWRVYLAISSAVMWRVILIIWAYISAAITSRLAFLPAVLSLSLLLTPVQQRLVHHTHRVFSLKHQLFILIIERHRFLPLEKIYIHIILYVLYLFSDLYEPSNHYCEGFMTLTEYAI